MSDPAVRTPWIGSQFAETKLLILGESHYWHEEGQDDPTLTNIVVEEVIAGKRFRFFTAMEGAVTGHPAADIQPASFWPTVAFANFCQGVVKKGERPDTAMWASGANSLHKVIELVKPTRMLVASTKAWQKFHDLTGIRWEAAEPILWKDREVETCHFVLERTGHRVYSTFIPHPQARDFGKGASWHPFVQGFFTRPLIHQ